MDFEKLIPEAEPIEIVERKVEPKDEEVSPWLFNGKPIESIPQEHETFVYLITNKKNGKRYIGFKTAVSRKTKIVNKKKRHIKVESDWKTYWSSSENLQDDVAKYGKGSFLREIIYLSVNKGVGKYLEAYEQFTRNALTTDGYYNGIVNLRIGKRTIGKVKDIVKADVILGDEIAKQFGYE